MPARPMSTLGYHRFVIKLMKIEPKSRSSSKSAAPPDPYEPPVPFPPFTLSDIPQQIGLLQSFYTRKMENMGEFLPDEEFENAIPALGPFGQIIVRATAAPKKPGVGRGRGGKRGGAA